MKPRGAMFLVARLSAQVYDRFSAKCWLPAMPFGLTSDGGEAGLPGLGLIEFGALLSNYSGVNIAFTGLQSYSGLQAQFC